MTIPNDDGFADNEPADHAADDVAARVYRLPATTDGLTRKSLAHKSLIDYVDDLFEKLYNKSPEFRALQEAVFDAEAVEGSMRADDYTSAAMIRDSVSEDHPVKPARLEAIKRSLVHVRRRWNISRKQRREEYDAIES